MFQDYIEISRNHPYLVAMDLDLFQASSGPWVVKWRDFLSMKQDAEFSTEAEARVFHSELWANAHKIPRELLDDACRSFEDASSFWESLV